MLNNIANYKIMYRGSGPYKHAQMAKNYSLNFFTLRINMIFVEELCCLNMLSCYMCMWLSDILIHLAFGSCPADAAEKEKKNINYINNFIEAMLFWEKSECEKKVRKQWYS